MRLVELLTAMVVKDTLGFVSSVASACHFLLSLVFKPTFSFLDNWFGISVKIEVTSALMRVEVVFLESVWAWNLSLFVNILFVKHHLAIVIVDHIPCFVQQIAPLIGCLPIFVFEGS